MNIPALISLLRSHAVLSDEDKDSIADALEGMMSWDLRFTAMEAATAEAIQQTGDLLRRIGVWCVTAGRQVGYDN